MKNDTKSIDDHRPELIGWREYVALPELGIGSLTAKIDTGAWTSALHTEENRIVEVNGETYVEFLVPNRRLGTLTPARAPLVDTRAIKNTGGVPEHRLIIRTMMVLGRHHWLVEVSLADRSNMGLDLIIGRSATRQRGMLVNPGSSFLQGPPTGPVKQSVKPRVPAMLAGSKKGPNQ